MKRIQKKYHNLVKYLSGHKKTTIILILMSFTFFPNPAYAHSIPAGLFLILQFPFILIIFALTVASKWIKSLIVQSSFGRRAGFSSKKLRKITIAEIILLTTVSIPIYWSQLRTINSYLRDFFFNLSDDKAIWYFEMIVDSGNVFFAFSVVLLFTTPICTLFALFFPNLYFHEIFNEEYRSGYMKFCRHIYAGILGFTTPTIIIIFMISISFLPSLKSYYDYSGLLIKAIDRGYPLKLVEALIMKGADVNTSDNKGKTPLMYGTGRIEIVRLLLSHGADIRAASDDGKTALMRAYNLDTMKILLNYGADINARDNKGRTFLMSIINYRMFEKAKYLIENGANVNAKDERGRTALIIACDDNQKSNYSRQLEVVKLLIENGADINVADDSGNTALIVASSNQDKSIKKLLLRYGAKSKRNLPKTKAIINQGISTGPHRIENGSSMRGGVSDTSRIHIIKPFPVSPSKKLILQPERSGSSGSSLNMKKRDN